MSEIELQARLRRLPPVGGLIADPRFAPLIDRFSRLRVTEALQQVISGWRVRILAGEAVDPDGPLLLRDASRLLESWASPSLVRVVNATGVVLNTNLGRAPLAAAALGHALSACDGYSNLEYDLARGERGERHAHFEDILVKLTGAEAAVAVNNNAAAVLLVVDTFARGKEVVVSRGELVEIGGSFRIPEVVTASGATLQEVGTTNKTRLADYARAVSPRTGLLLKCHASNFRMVGFTEQVEGAELASLAREVGVPAAWDLGSGVFVDLGAFGLPHEPTVQDAVSAGLDLVTFSGDKLLGGPQAGIIVGRKELVSRIRTNPLLRALRLDKVAVALLEATLRLYLDPDQACREVPALGMLCAPPGALRPRAESLAARLRGLGWPALAAESVSAPGGGSLPGVEIPTWVVRASPECGAQALCDRLRLARVVGRIEDEALLLDMRTLLEGDDDRILEAFGAAGDGDGGPA